MKQNVQFFGTPWTIARHGISQARLLEWVAISFSGESSQPRGRTHIPCIAGGFFTNEPPGKLMKQNVEPQSRPS